MISAVSQSPARGRLFDRSMASRDSTSHRLPGLDGLRAVSILLVIGYHLHMSGAMPAWTSALFQNGSFGVEIFFTISGLLITWLLLREEAAHGSISLGQFYARRAVRILPPAMAYLLVILIVSLAQGTMLWKPWISALFFFRNFHMTDAVSRGLVDTAHYWSLSTEEQFYLIWPLIFLLLRPSLRVPALLGLLVAEPIWRHVNTHMAHGGHTDIFRIDLHCDGILMGCLLACAMEDHRGRKILSSSFFRSDLAAILALAVIAATFTQRALSLPGQVIYPSIRAACVALIVYRVIRRAGRSPSAVDLLLNLSPIVFIGQLSYSLYLWQQPFCMPAGMLRTASPILNVIAACACAIGSFLLIERPAQMLRRKLGSRTAISSAPYADTSPAI
jgi:peptidoglycan/LPS O-acetylase OafA/YrhL